MHLYVIVYYLAVTHAMAMCQAWNDLADYSIYNFQ